MSSAVAGRPATDAIDDHSRQQRLKLAAGLRDLADRVEQQPELMSRAADLMSQDFMDNRAPPPEVDSCVSCTVYQAFSFGMSAGHNCCWCASVTVFSEMHMGCQKSAADLTCRLGFVGISPKVTCRQWYDFAHKYKTCFASHLSCCQL